MLGLGFTLTLNPKPREPDRQSNLGTDPEPKIGQRLPSSHFFFLIGEISPKSEFQNSKFEKLNDFGGFQLLDVRGQN
jgi:hypothetical protein